MLTFSFSRIQRAPRSTLFPYTTLFRSAAIHADPHAPIVLNQSIEKDRRAPANGDTSTGIRFNRSPVYKNHGSLVDHHSPRSSTKPNLDKRDCGRARNSHDIAGRACCAADEYSGGRCVDREALAIHDPHIFLTALRRQRDLMRPCDVQGIDCRLQGGDRSWSCSAAVHCQIRRPSNEGEQNRANEREQPQMNLSMRSSHCRLLLVSSNLCVVLLELTSPLASILERAGTFPGYACDQRPARRTDHQSRRGRRQRLAARRGI